MAITADSAAGGEVYNALMILQTEDESGERQAALLRAVRPEVLHYIADAVFAEWEGLCEATIIENILDML